MPKGRRWLTLTAPPVSVWAQLSVWLESMGAAMYLCKNKHVDPTTLVTKREAKTPAPWPTDDMTQPRLAMPAQSSLAILWFCTCKFTSRLRLFCNPMLSQSETFINDTSSHPAHMLPGRSNRAMLHLPVLHSRCTCVSFPPSTGALFFTMCC